MVWDWNRIGDRMIESRITRNRVAIEVTKRKAQFGHVLEASRRVNAFLGVHAVFGGQYVADAEVTSGKRARNSSRDHGFKWTVSRNLKRGAARGIGPTDACDDNSSLILLADGGRLGLDSGHNENAHAGGTPAREATRDPGRKVSQRHVKLLAGIEVLDDGTATAHFIAEHHGKASVAVGCLFELLANVAGRLPCVPDMQTSVSQGRGKWDEHRFGRILTRGEHKHIRSGKHCLIVVK